MFSRSADGRRNRPDHGLVTCPGFAEDEAFEKYVNALSELAERWQEILDTDDESVDAEA